MDPDTAHPTIATLRDQSLTGYDELPPEVAERTQPGHQLEPDPPTMSAVDRWTCTTCGRAVLANGPVIYGSATTQPCNPPKDQS